MEIMFGDSSISCFAIMQYLKQCEVLAQLPQLRGLLHFFAWVFDKSGQLILNIA